MPFHIRNRGKRADGSTKWQCRWSHPDDPKQRVERQFRDKDVAKRWGIRMEAAANGSMFKEPARVRRTFGELVATWEATCWPALAPKTRARYRSLLETYLLPRFCSTQVREMTREVVRLYFAELARNPRPGGKTPPSAGTIRKVHTCMSAAMREALDMELIDANPCARVRGLAPVRPRPGIALTAEEVAALSREVDAVTTKLRGRRYRYDPGYGLAVFVAGYCGLRAGELWALRRRDVDVPHRKLHVREAVKDLDAADPAERYGPPKSGKTRVVALPRFLAAMLDEHLRKEPCPAGTGPDTLVFCSVLGGSVRHELWRRRYFNPAVRRALPPEKHRLRVHDLRHSAASIYAAQPHTSLLQLKERLGHAKIGMTGDLYAHLFEDHDREAMDALDAAYEQASNVVPLRARP